MTATIRLALLSFICFNTANILAEDAVSPFNGKDLTGWTTKEPRDRSKWKAGVAELQKEHPEALQIREVPEKQTPELINAEGHGVDLISEQKFGDCRIQLELMVPRGSNSGVYVMGEYEVQILDSFGKEKVGPGDIGGLYGAAAPKLNASKKPGEWQSLEIEFTAPRFVNGKKSANAKFVKVILNGMTIHENAEMAGPTPGGVTGKEAESGPIMFQGDHGPVALRNIKITPKK
jgi:Domain of Unknown Function (DUF1080)